MPSSAHRPRHRLAAEVAVGDVAAENERAAPLALDRSPGLLGIAVLGEMGDGDVGALAGEEHGDGAADPESAPVISATLPSSLPEPFQKGASYIGAGSSFASSPGFG